MEEAKTKFEEQLEAERQARDPNEDPPAEEAKFDPDDFNNDYDEQNPEIDIPDEVEDDIDLDYNLDEDD